MAARVPDAEAGDHAIGDNPNAEPPGHRPGGLPVEEQLRPIGPPEVELLSEDLLEAPPAAQRPIEVVGPTHPAGQSVGPKEGKRWQGW